MELEKLILQLKNDLKDKRLASKLALAEAGVLHHQTMLVMMREQGYSASVIADEKSMLAVAEERLVEVQLEMAEAELATRKG